MRFDHRRFQGGPGERYNVEIENGVVPGNRNKDDVDALFYQRLLLTFPLEDHSD